MVPLVPSPDTIPAPWWVFETLGIVTFFIHILLINLVLGGTFMVAMGRLLGDRCRLGGLGQVLRGKIPTMLALGINFGVAPLLFLQVNYGHLFYASSVLMGVTWILVIPLLIVGYYGAYVHNARPGSRLGLGAILLSLLIFLYVAFAVTNNVSLMERPAAWTAYFDNPGGTTLNVADPVFWPRWLHMVVASLGVSALAAAMLWNRRIRKGQVPAEQAQPHVRFGLRVFGVTALIQVAVGLWYFMAVPSTVRGAFMGQDMLATVVFSLGMLLGLVSILTAFMGRLQATVGLLVGTLVFMVVLRAALRRITIQGFADATQLQLAPQYFNLGLFLFVFVVGLGIVAWMVRGAFRTNPEVSK